MKRLKKTIFTYHSMCNSAAMFVMCISNKKKKKAEKMSAQSAGKFVERITAIDQRSKKPIAPISIRADKITRYRRGREKPPGGASGRRRRRRPGARAGREREMIARPSGRPRANAPDEFERSNKSFPSNAIKASNRIGDERAPGFHSSDALQMFYCN